MLPLHAHADVAGGWKSPIAKVLELEEALEGRFPLESVVLDLRRGLPVSPGVLKALGFAGVLGIPDAAACGVPSLSVLSHDEVVRPGDVIRIRERGQISVLFRRGANANFLFATERCNSYCLMCSQPPRDEDDSWRVGEILKTIPLIDSETTAIGLTGGEPTLLGSDLAQIIRTVQAHLGHAQFNILTNARLMVDERLADELCVANSPVLWAVPLYADTAARHDHVVQAQGAFEETINGLYNLAERRQAVELRIVLHRQTVPRLVQFAEFVWRNLPFVAHVAFMGLEPMGFAKRNRDALYIDAAEYRGALERAVWYLVDRGIRASIYNTPLCLLSAGIRRHTKRSISDWKNKFAPECDGCTMQDSCAGFFKSAGAKWRSRSIRPIREGEGT